MSFITKDTVIVALYLICALAVTSIGVWTYNKIYDRGYSDAVVIAEKEKTALKAANDQAIFAAEKKLRDSVTTLTMEKEKLEDDIARLNHEAAEDPDAGAGGIKRSSVQRLNSVR